MQDHRRLATRAALQRREAELKANRRKQEFGDPI
jgi:hypothetical protein